MPRAIGMRERLPDNYDPPEQFKWVVELNTAFGWTDEYRLWNGANIRNDWTLRYGTKAGFVDRDDAMLFYLRYA